MTKLQIALYRKNLVALLNPATRPTTEEAPELAGVFSAFDAVELPDINDLVLRIAQAPPALRQQMLRHKPEMFGPEIITQLQEFGVDTSCLGEGE